MKLPLPPTNPGIHRDRHPDQGLGGGDRRAEVAVQGDEEARRRLRLGVVSLVLGAQVHGGVPRVDPARQGAPPLRADGGAAGGTAGRGLAAGDQAGRVAAVGHRQGMQ